MYKSLLILKPMNELIITKPKRRLDTQLNFHRWLKNFLSYFAYFKLQTHPLIRQENKFYWMINMKICSSDKTKYNIYEFKLKYTSHMRDLLSLSVSKDNPLDSSFIHTPHLLLTLKCSVMKVETTSNANMEDVLHKKELSHFTLWFVLSMRISWDSLRTFVLNFKGAICICC